MVRNRSWPAVSHCEDRAELVSEKTETNMIQSLSLLISLQPCIYTLCSPYNLKLYGLSVQLDGPDLEVHTDGANVALCVCVILA